MILCCGEALIDMIPRVLDDGRTAFVPASGGAVFNTAIAIGRLGAPAGFFSAMSSDLFGDQLRRALAESRVTTHYVVISDRLTTLAFVILDEGQARYVFFDEGSAGRMLDQDHLPALDDEVDMLFFGGISLIGEPCGSTFEALARREHTRRLIMLDPNIRPGFVTDETAYRRRLQRMISYCDILKMSDEDLAWLDRASDADEFIAALVERGPDLVILTRGAGLATAFTRTERIDVRARTVAVTDTIGAGDTFNAGVLTGLHERGLASKDGIRNIHRQDVEAIMNLGMTAASVTVSREGADPPWRDQITDWAEIGITSPY